MGLETKSGRRNGDAPVPAVSSPLRWAKPLRVHLSFIIVLLLLATSVPMMLLTFYDGRKDALDSAAQQMRLLSRGTVDLYQNMFRDGHNVITVGAVVPSLSANPPAWLDSKREFLVRELNGSPYLDGIYVGYPSGAFFHIMRAAGKPEWKASVSAPDEAVFGMRVVLRGRAGHGWETWHFLDQDGNSIGSGEERRTDFDPRRRPWYRAAVSESGPVSAGPYIGASTGTLTLTLAAPTVDSPEVIVGADVLLNTISQMLSEHAVSENSVGYVFDGQGRLIVHSDPDIMAELAGDLSTQPLGPATLAVNDDPRLAPEVLGEALALAEPAAEKGAIDPVLDAARGLLANASDTTGPPAEFRVDGEPWLAHLSSFGEAHLLEGYRIVIAAPVADFTAASIALLRKTLSVAGIFVLAGIVIALVISRRISRALVALAQDATQIGNLDFQNWRVTRSLITEVNMLARALNSAREAIRSFAIYVPRELVRQIVASDQSVAGAAVRREVTVLFSDIRDFTTISEQHTPEEVVDMLTEYFEVMNVIVERHNGVIAQYLGDSIYAMWNAPAENERHVEDGCRCVLALKVAIDDLNARNAAVGRPELVTRFGLHTGVAVVGSVGAEDRRQYTAMGDTVNVASRLEGMNKQFDTSILTTAAVRDGVGGLGGIGFRPLGAVTAKGRHEQIEIFELTEAIKAA